MKPQSSLKKSSVKAPAERVEKDIRRQTRRHFSAEDKIRIVLDGLRGDDSIAELCRKEGIAQSLYYVWSKEFMEAGKRRLAGDTARAATTGEVQDFPQITTLTMQECPGTFDDRANLKVGRMIRAAGIVTYVPAGGSVRSGGVELFLAGVERRIDDGAKFAVHAWEDDAGLEASDYSATAPENRKYLAYYREMGMSEGEASAFYAMTNSVPHEQARWLDAAEMRRWLGQNGSMTETAPAPPRLAYLDLNALLN